jgi:hypothetical protein
MNEYTDENVAVQLPEPVPVQIVEPVRLRGEPGKRFAAGSRLIDTTQEQPIQIVHANPRRARIVVTVSASYWIGPNQAGVKAKDRNAFNAGSTSIAYEMFHQDDIWAWPDAGSATISWFEEVWQEES